MKKLFMVITIFFMMAGVANAKNMSVTLAWDKNTESDLAGYKVHYGIASEAYSQHEDVGNVTQYKVEGLAYGAIYYFAVTAYDTEGLESGYSNEVFYDSLTGLAPIPPNSLKPIQIDVIRSDGTTVVITIP